MKALQQYGVATVIEMVEFNGVLQVLLCNFLGSDNKYYSFCCAYNDVAVFSIFGNGKECTNWDSLVEDCSKVFDNTAEFKRKRCTEIAAKCTLFRITQGLLRGTAEGLAYKDLRIASYKKYLSPFAGVSVVVTKGDRVLVSFVCIHGQKTGIRLDCDEDTLVDFKQLLQQAGLDGFVGEVVL